MTKPLTFMDLVTIAHECDFDQAELGETWRELFHVYNNALYNPPEGVIGVGAITHAQNKLAEYQNQNRKES